MITRVRMWIVLSLALAGCPGAADVPVAEPKAPARPAALNVSVLEAARDLDGHPVGGLAVGERATVAMVFASWCGHCQDEMPVLAALRERHPEVRFLGVNYRAHEEYDGRGDASAVRRFVAERGPWLRVIPADDALWAALGRPPKVPTLYVFGADGDLTRRFDRRVDPLPTLDDLEAALAR